MSWSRCTRVLTHPGKSSTLDEHLPPEHIAYKMRDQSWCLSKADAVGPYYRTMIDRLFYDDLGMSGSGHFGTVRTLKNFKSEVLSTAT